MPAVVYVLWIVVLAVAVLLLPFIIRLLHKTLLAAMSIERYLREMKEAGLGIAGNTGHIPALDNTISVASSMLECASQINGNAETIKLTMAQRAAKLN